MTTVAAALSALATAIKAVEKTAGDLQRASPPQLAPVNLALRTAQSVLDARITAVESGIVETSLGGVVPAGTGVSVTTMIESLSAQTTAINQADALRTSRAYLGRIGHNLKVIS